MIRKILFFISVVLFILSCNNKNERPTTSLETGTAFIRAMLDGDFDRANTLLYKDTMNVESFASYKSYYKGRPEEEKAKYKASDYTINKYADIDDSTIIINYSNSYMKKPMEIKVIRKDGDWQIDFKYTLSGNLPIN